MCVLCVCVCVCIHPHINMPMPMPIQELEEKTADAAALRAAIGERTSLWDLLKAHILKTSSP